MEQNIQVQWTTLKGINIHAVGIPESEERKRTQIIEAIITKNFSKLLLAIKPQIQEFQRTLSKINAKCKLNSIFH